MAVSGGPVPAARRVLVLRALGVGDLLTAAPALRAVRRATPAGRRLVLAAPESLAGLVELTDTVDELLPTAGLGPLQWNFPPPTLAVNLHGSGPESIETVLALRPERVWTFRHARRPTLDGPHWDAAEHEVARWCRLLEHYGVPADPADLRLRAPAVPSAAPGAVVIHPGAAQPARQWLPTRFAEVAAAIAAARPGTPIVVTGSAREREAALTVAAEAGLGERAVLAGQTDLVALAALVAGARLLISGDTGAAHLATAYGTPSITLFGPTDPARWGPAVDADLHRVLWAGATGDPHADLPDAGLLRITAAEVARAAVDMLSVRHG